MTTRIPNNQIKTIRNYAARNIIYLLNKLDIEYYDRGNHLLQGRCPCKFHGGDGDNTTAFSWRKDIGKWVCWTHHCEEARGNDIFGLVSSVLDLTFTDTFDWVSKQLEACNINTSEEVLPLESNSRGNSLHVHEAIKEDNLKFLQPDPQYLIRRDFDIDVLRRYEVGMWSRPGTFMHDRVVFPIRDHDGYLIGYTGRTVHPEAYFKKRGLTYSKWIHGRHYNVWPKRGELLTGSILYNLFNAKRYINDSNKSMILVEGPLDGIKLEEARIHNWVATLSTNFCHAHRTLLIKAGVTDLYVAYDNDENHAGDKGWIRMKRIVGDLLNLHRIQLPPGLDCGDLTTEQLKLIFRDIIC